MLLCLSYDIIDIIASSLDLESYLNFSYCCRYVRQLLQSDATARKCLQVSE